MSAIHLPSILRCLPVIMVFVFSTLSGAEPINARCPVTPDESADPAITVDYNGHTIGFCCRRCVRMFRADPARYPLPTAAGPSPVDAGPAGDSETAQGPEYRASLGDADHAVQGAANSDPALQNLNSSRTLDSEDSTANARSSASDHHVHDGGGGFYHHGGVNGVESDTNHGSEGGDQAHAEHDHGGDGHSHGEDLLARIGRFHVLAIHFPIALLVLAAVVCLWDALRPHPIARGSALLLTHTGALAAVVAALLGWATWSGASYPDAQDVLAWHQWLGTSTAVLATLAAICAGARLQEPRWPWAWRSTLWITAALVSITGHFGGTLIYGPGYAW